MPWRAAIAWAAMGLAGCASTRTEPPPAVAEQPPDITASQAVAEGERANLQAEAQVAAAEGRSDGALIASTAPVPAPRQSAAERYRPTERSIEEIRGQHRDAPPALDFNQRLDHLHDRLYTWTQGVVEATDHRFAVNGRELKPVPAAPFRIGLTTETIKRSGSVDFGLDADLDMALSLPNIEDRLRIFVTSNELDESPDTRGDNSRLRAGLRYEFMRHVDFDLGVQLDLPPVAFASVRWQREFRLGDWDFYPMAKLFIETEESLGYSAAATFDRWSGRHLLRTSTFAKWRNDRDETQWSQSLIYARANELIVPQRYGSYLRANDIGRGWGVRLHASGETTSEVSYYETGVFYRRPASQNRWLYWYVEPIVRWDRKYDWNADPGIRIGIDMLFWDLARPAR